MPKGSRGGGGGGAAVAPAPAPAPVPAPVFSDTDSAGYHQLYNGRGYYAKQDIDAAQQAAIDTYLDATAIPGTMYSPSQTLNYKLRQGIPLTASEQQMYKDLNSSMHNLGYNLTLTRYDRVDYLTSTLGITTNPNRLTTRSLQSLIGKTVTDDAFISTSYNDFAKAPVGNCFTDKTVRLNIKAPAKTQAVMPGVGPGGDFGEIVLGPGQSYRITGARVNRKTTRSGATYYNNQIEIDVEII